MSARPMDSLSVAISRLTAAMEDYRVALTEIVQNDPRELDQAAGDTQRAIASILEELEAQS